MLTMFKAVSDFFKLKKKNRYNPSNLYCKLSTDQKGIHKECFRNLGSLTTDDKENEKTSTSETKKPFSMETFTFISPIPEERYNDVIAYLKDHLTDKPLLKHLGLMDVGDSLERLEAYTLETLQNHLSVMIVDLNDRVVAVSVSAIELPTHKDPKMEYNRRKSYKQMCDLIKDLNGSVDLFFKFNIESIFTVHILSVHIHFRKSGLFEEIIRRTEKLAEQNNFEVMKTKVSEPIFLQILQSIGWELVNEVKYEDYISDIVFETCEPPCNTVKVMVKILQCGSCDLMNEVMKL